MEKWKMLDSRVIVDTPWLTLKADRCITQSGVEIPNYYWFEGHHYVLVLGTTIDGKVILIEQYRHGAKEVLLEFPSGLIEEGEELLETAKRELKEETGYAAEEIIFERGLFTSPAISDKKGYLCFAKNLIKVGEQELEPTEHINVRLVDFDELQKLVDNNELRSAVSTAAVLLAMQKREWFLG